MCDESIPLVTKEWKEWGNPNQKVWYDHMIQWAPMEKIVPAIYPNTLITCGLLDKRVGWWEAMKLHIRLKDNDTSNALHLIKVNMNEGHGCFANRCINIDAYTFKYSFMLKCLGLD